MTRPKRPLCSAAATAVLIDVDKGVRPCCAYEGKHQPWTVSVGKLDQSSLRGILEGPEWQRVREQLANHEVPQGCEACIERERLVGSSERITIERRRSPNWERGITYFELDSSNLCNLQCRHCSSMYSSRWSKHEARMGRSQEKVVLPDSEMLIANLRELDLRYVEMVSLKGGEPMLNSDMLALLRYLDEIGVIGNVHFYMVTNGTVITPAVLELLRRGKKLTVAVSVDGVGLVQTYIRHGGSEIEKLERSIATYAAMPNAELTRNTSVMAYNAFSLDRVDAWWDSLARRFPGNYLQTAYGLFVLHPEYLSVQVLQDHTRAALRERYTALDRKRYAPVIRALELPFAGTKLHDAFVDYTHRLDQELGRSVLDAVPEIAAELVRLEPHRAVPAAATAPSAPGGTGAAHASPAAEASTTAVIELATPPAAKAPPLAPPAMLVEAMLAKVWAHLNAGDVATARGLADETAPWLTTALHADLRAALLHAQGAIAALGGQLATGLVFLDEALAIRPNDRGILLHRARVLEALGRRDSAAADARLAASDPRYATEARELLSRCGGQ